MLTSVLVSSNYQDPVSLHEHSSDASCKLWCCQSQRSILQFQHWEKLSYRKDIHHNPIIKYASRCLEVATCFVRQTISWSSNESRIKHQNIALKSTMTKQWNSLLPQWNYLHFTREFVYISHLRSVMPKSYKPEVYPKSTSDEFLSRVIENCRLFQYGGLFRFYQQPKRRDWTRHEHCYMLYMWWIHCRV